MRTRFALLVCLVSMASLALVIGGCKKEPKKEAPTEEADNDDDSDDDDDDDDDKKKPKKGDDDDDDEGSGASVGLAASAVKSAIAGFMKDEKTALSPKVLEAFVISLKACELKKFGPNYKCAEYKAYQKARRRKTRVKGLFGMYAKVGAKLINHKNETVRHTAASLMSSLFGSSKKSQDAIISVAKKEKNPFVLAKMISVVGSRIKKNEDVKKLLVKNADHEEPAVRMAALTWFTNSFAKDVDGVFDIALKKVDDDKDIAVRAFLCARLYGTGDKRAIKVFKKYVDDPKADIKMYRGCFRGMVNAWIGIPRTKNPNQEAYQHTLKLLKKKPRDKDHPPSNIFMMLGYAKEETKFTYQKEWLAKVKGFYKAKTLRKVLADIIADEDANWMGRSSAVRSYKELGGSNKDLKKMKKKLGKGSKNRFVVKAIDRALKKK